MVFLNLQEKGETLTAELQKKYRMTKGLVGERDALAEEKSKLLEVIDRQNSEKMDKTRALEMLSERHRDQEQVAKQNKQQSDSYYRQLQQTREELENMTAQARESDAMVEALTNSLTETNQDFLTYVNDLLKCSWIVPFPTLVSA